MAVLFLEGARSVLNMRTMTQYNAVRLVGVQAFGYRMISHLNFRTYLRF